jgi:hypothetical protein
MVMAQKLRAGTYGQAAVHRVYTPMLRPKSSRRGDDRVSDTDADRHDDVSRIGSSEFGGNTDSAVSLKMGPEPKLCLPAIECVASNIGNHSVTRWRRPYS